MKPALGFIILLLGQHYIAVATASKANLGKAERHTSDRKGADREHTKTQNPSWNSRTMFYSFGIALTMALGYAWFACTVGTDNRIVGLISMLATLCHGVCQFLPWFPLYFGQAHCHDGLPWEWHLAYSIVLAIATPMLSLAVADTGGQGAIPIIGVKGGPFHVYLYLTTVLQAFDSYSDSAAAVLAFSCGWQYAWLMAMALFLSLLIQAMSAYAFGGPKGMAASLLGMNTEAYAQSVPASRSDTKEEVERSHAVLSITRLITEVIPQSFLSWLFASEVKPNKLIWISITLSLSMGIKSFISGVLYFCKAPTTHEPLPAADENME